MPLPSKNIQTTPTDTFGTQEDAPSPVTKDAAFTPVDPGAVEHTQTEGSDSQVPDINIYPPKVSNWPRRNMGESTTELPMLLNETGLAASKDDPDISKGFFTSIFSLYGHVSNNTEEFILYVVLGVCIGIILALIFFMTDLKWKNKKLKKKVKNINPASDSGVTQSTTGSANDRTDSSRPRTVHLSIDEADRMDINELWRTMTPTSTLQRREHNNNRVNVNSQVWSTPPPHMSSREDNSRASSENGHTYRPLENGVHHSLDRKGQRSTGDRSYGGYARIPTLERDRTDQGLYASIDSPPQSHATTSFTHTNQTRNVRPISEPNEVDNLDESIPHYRPSMGRGHKTLERSSSAYDNGPVYSQPKEHPFKINSNRKPQPVSAHSGLYATVQPKSMRNGGSNANRLDRSTSLTGQSITTSVQEVDQRQQYSISSGAVPKQSVNGVVYNQEQSILAPVNNDSGVQADIVALNGIGHDRPLPEPNKKKEIETSNENLEFDLDHALENILGPGFGNFNDIWNRENLPGTQNLNSYF